LSDGQAWAWWRGRKRYKNLEGGKKEMERESESERVRVREKKSRFLLFKPYMPTQHISDDGCHLHPLDYALTFFFFFFLHMRSVIVDRKVIELYNAYCSFEITFSLG
jgi:hypothetical protein